MNNILAITPNRFSPAHHRWALGISTQVTTNIREMYFPKAANVLPRDVIKILNAAKIKFVLVGAHGISGWLGDPRATQDVDVLIQSRHKKAIEAIKKEYPDLLLHDNPVVTQFIDPEKKLSVIDLIKPHNRLFKAALKNTYPVGDTYRIPELEMAIALKFAAMISSNRTFKRRNQDKTDLIDMVASNREILELPKLRKFGELVKPGGGQQIVDVVNDILKQTEGEENIDETDF